VARHAHNGFAQNGASLRIWVKNRSGTIAKETTAVCASVLCLEAAALALCARRRASRPASRALPRRTNTGTDGRPPRHFRIARRKRSCWEPVPIRLRLVRSSSGMGLRRRARIPAKALVSRGELRCDTLAGGCRPERPARSRVAPIRSGRRRLFTTGQCGCQRVQRRHRQDG
jgi:hypothetical protein